MESNILKYDLPFLPKEQILSANQSWVGYTIKVGYQLLSISIIYIIYVIYIILSLSLFFRKSSVGCIRECYQRRFWKGGISLVVFSRSLLLFQYTIVMLCFLSDIHSQYPPSLPSYLYNDNNINNQRVDMFQSLVLIY